jgi:hypothetical protein
MANYYASARTNYFLVKDVEAFTTDINAVTSYVNIITHTTKDGLELVGLLGNDPDGSGFPYSQYSDEDGEYLEINWDKIFQAHLEDGWVAIIMESGAEKLRYISGYAVAYNNKGETRTIDLTNIYKLAMELGDNVTPAEY